ncbi:hypothetical protein, partial [Komagataeibacter kakiaceti]|uniref:hypothetical protein n=1 Tax=Komagataeibacter kakiaceti TaxID=943261 RepID=UPI00054D199E
MPGTGQGASSSRLLMLWRVVLFGLLLWCMGAGAGRAQTPAPDSSTSGMSREQAQQVLAVINRTRK